MLQGQMRRGAIVAAAAFALGLAPAARATAASEACQEMRQQLIRGGGHASGLFVVDGDTGQAVCSRAARRQRPLASNMKLFTTATALARFGPRFRIATSVLADGELDGDGVLHGNLYLRGAGDPALGAPAFYERFLGGLGTNLFALKSQIRAAGVSAVRGRLYADDTIFDRLRGVADSGYATSSYIGPLSGLSFNSGYLNSSASGFASDPARLAAAKARPLAARGRSRDAAEGRAGLHPRDRRAARHRPLADHVAAGRDHRRLLRQLLCRDADQADRSTLRR